VRLFDSDRVETRAVAVTVERALVETAEAFNGVATEYDRSNTDNPLLAAMRRRVLAAVGACVPRGARILDLGCGPGTDDETLARAGYELTAIDWSPAMVDEARRRIERADLRDRVRVLHLGIHELDVLPPFAFDAALSNFGPLNCVPELDTAARAIAARLKHGAVLIASVIGRFCPWEILVHALRGDVRRASIRFRRDVVGVPLNGGTVWTRYYAPSEFERVFLAAGFERVCLRALGLFTPPPYMEAFAARHPSLVARLQALDDFAGRWPAFRSLGDHFLIVLRRA
jgi:SAM-dependent methyltransferase